MHFYTEQALNVQMENPPYATYVAQGGFVRLSKRRIKRR